MKPSETQEAPRRAGGTIDRNWIDGLLDPLPLRLILQGGAGLLVVLALFLWLAGDKVKPGERGDEAYEEKRYEKAERFYRNSLPDYDKGPLEGQAAQRALRHARCLLELGRSDEAARRLEQVQTVWGDPEARPNQWASLYNTLLAWTRIEAEDLEAAGAASSRAMRYPEADALARAVALRLALARGDLDAADKHYYRIAENPDFAEEREAYLKQANRALAGEDAPQPSPAP